MVPVNTPGGATRVLSQDNDYTATFSPLLFGTTCQVEETKTGGANSSVITDANGDEVSEFTVDSLDEDLQFAVTNTFDTGSIAVQKTVRGEGPNKFEVSLRCVHDVDGTPMTVDIPGGATRDLVRCVRPTTAARTRSRSRRTTVNPPWASWPWATGRRSS